MENKPFKSIVRRMMAVPIITFIVVMVFTVVSSILSFINMQQRIVDGIRSALNADMIQFENQLIQIDERFYSYWINNESYMFLKSFDSDTPRNQYWSYWVDSKEWYEQLISDFSMVEGACVYYANIDQMHFKNKRKNFDDHVVFRDLVLNQKIEKNTWQLMDVNGKQYLIIFKQNGQSYGAVWCDVQDIMKILGIDNSNNPGIVYLIDQYGNNSCKEEDLRDYLSQEDPQKATYKFQGNTYNHYSIDSAQEKISLGLIIKRNDLLSALPWQYWCVMILTVFSVFLILINWGWTRRMFIKPFMSIDKAVEHIGSGDMDYRLPMRDVPYYDEFDFLTFRINEMLDRLTELEYNLYITKIKEQRTQLKYISQQIRPHFILNALNVVYSYNEDEFGLAKKMIMYLTQYFRYIVNLRVDFVELKDELRHAENYLNIQKMRYESRFDYMVHWSKEAAKQLIPPLIIQTFLENSIKYGLKEEGRTLICVRAVVEDEFLVIDISDAGYGFQEDKLALIQEFIKTREYSDQLGVGIQNCIERMDILYDQKVDIRIMNMKEGGALVEIRLPAKGN